LSSRNIVVEHGGELQIESLEGQGTTVTLSFPLIPDRLASAS
jgi:signal transduction histidine kinase